MIRRVKGWFHALNDRFLAEMRDKDPLKAVKDDLLRRRSPAGTDPIPDNGAAGPDDAESAAVSGEEPDEG